MISLLLSLFFIAVLACSTEDGEERKGIGDKGVKTTLPPGAGSTNPEGSNSNSSKDGSSQSPGTKKYPEICSGEDQTNTLPIGSAEKRPACLIMENWLNKRVLIDPDANLSAMNSYVGYCLDVNQFNNSLAFKVRPDKGLVVYKKQGESCLVFEYENQKNQAGCNEGDHVVQLECESFKQDYCFSTQVFGSESLLETRDSNSSFIKDNLSCKQ